MAPKPLAKPIKPLWENGPQPTKQQIQSESDAGDMSGYDPNLRMTPHVSAIQGHLKAVGLKPTSPGAQDFIEGVHKAAMATVFPPPAKPATRGTSSGYMVGKGK